MVRILWLVGILFLLVTEIASAQSFYSRNRDRSWVISGGVGIGSYFGDLNNPGDIIDFTPDAVFGMRYNLSNRLSVGANAGWFMLRGDDTEADHEGRMVRNLSFSSHNFELSFAGYVDLYPRGSRFYQRPVVNPYAFAGFGFTYFNPRAKYNGKWHALRPLKTEGVSYSPITAVIPLGLGLKFRATPFINIVLEGGYRFTFTDYLDDVSTVYQDPNSFTDEIARALADRRPEIGLPRWEAGRIRGHAENNDGYFIFSLKAEYFIPDIFSKSPNRINRSMRRRR